MATGYEYNDGPSAYDLRTIAEKVQNTKKLYTLGLITLPEYYSRMNKYRAEMGLAPWPV